MPQHAEKAGIWCFWLAEHLYGWDCEFRKRQFYLGIHRQTQKIRLGSGGIMLPNHAPLVVAEQFGTLATLYPNRFELGLGRAPGTDQMTMHLRRGRQETEDQFPQDVMEILQYFKDPQPNQKIITATPVSKALMYPSGC